MVYSPRWKRPAFPVRYVLFSVVCSTAYVPSLSMNPISIRSASSSTDRSKAWRIGQWSSDIMSNPAGRLAVHDIATLANCVKWSTIIHDDVIKWKHFPRNWPFVREIHRSPVNFPHKGQWRGALMFSLIYAWINDWVNNRGAGELRRQHGHYDVIVMLMCPSTQPIPIFRPHYTIRSWGIREYRN